MEDKTSATLSVRYKVLKETDCEQEIDISPEDANYLLNKNYVPAVRNAKVEEIIKDWHIQEDEDLGEGDSLKITSYSVDMPLEAKFQVLLGRLNNSVPMSPQATSAIEELRGFLTVYLGEIESIKFKE